MSPVSSNVYSEALSAESVASQEGTLKYPHRSRIPQLSVDGTVSLPPAPSSLLCHLALSTLLSGARNLPSPSFTRLSGAEAGLPGPGLHHQISRGHGSWRERAWLGAASSLAPLGSVARCGRKGRGVHRAAKPVSRAGSGLCSLAVPSRAQAGRGAVQLSDISDRHKTLEGGRSRTPIRKLGPKAFVPDQAPSVSLAPGEV